ncbi:hypothetical protein ACC668_10470 [Rhizobium ruizarguesonis]
MSENLQYQSILEMSHKFSEFAEKLGALTGKIDGFITLQTGQKTEIDALKTDVSAVKADVAEIKTQRKITLAGIGLAAGGCSWLIGQFAEPLLKKFLGT